MSFFSKLFGKREDRSASVAKERLMIAIATDRQNTLIPDLDQMRRDIIAVLEKYIQIDDIDIKKEKKGDLEMLEIGVTVKKASDN